MSKDQWCLGTGSPIKAEVCVQKYYFQAHLYISKLNRLDQSTLGDKILQALLNVMAEIRIVYQVEPREKDHHFITILAMLGTLECYWYTFLKLRLFKFTSTKQRSKFHDVSDGNAPVLTPTKEEVRKHECILALHRDVVTSILSWKQYTANKLKSLN